MKNSIYRRPFTPRCFTNYKHTSPHHRTGKTANFKVSAGKIPHTAHCRERFTCQIPKGKAVLRTREGLLLDSRHVQAASQTKGSSFSSLEIIWMVFECLHLNDVTPSLPKLKPSLFYCISTFARSMWLFTLSSSPNKCSSPFPSHTLVPDTPSSQTEVLQHHTSAKTQKEKLKSCVSV